MSTAEAVSTGYAAGHARLVLRRAGEVRRRTWSQHLIGTALKDAPDDLKKLRHYFNHVVQGRGGGACGADYDARTLP